MLYDQSLYYSEIFYDAPRDNAGDGVNENVYVLVAPVTPLSVGVVGKNVLSFPTRIYQYFFSVVEVN